MRASDNREARLKSRANKFTFKDSRQNPVKTNQDIQPNLTAKISSAKRNDLTPTLSVKQRPIAELKFSPRRLRKSERSHIQDVASSVERFGFSLPIVTKHDEIVDGHIRLEAARELGLDTVPCIEVDHLTKEETRLLRLAINRLQEKGEWDLDVLRLEFEELLDLDISLDGIGFEVPEIDFVLNFDGDDDPQIDAKSNAIPSIDSEHAPVSHLGDIWQLGDHRLICGDATKPDTYATLLEGKLAQLVITDPPYNVPIDGHAGGAGSIKHAEFPMASGEMTDTEFTLFLEAFLGRAKQSVVDNALLYTFMDWRHIEQLLQAARQKDLDLVNLCVWVKSNGGLGGFYRSRHELISVFRKGSGSHTNNVQLGRYGRNRTNVWEYAGVNTLDPKKRAELQLHPTVKPVELIADAMLDASAPKDIVLDPFLGSGTTCVAAEQTKRICYGIELDPRYVDVAIKRWQDFTGNTALHHQSGQTFEKLAAEQKSKNSLKEAAATTGTTPQSATSTSDTTLSEGGSES